MKGSSYWVLSKIALKIHWKPMLEVACNWMSGERTWDLWQFGTLSVVNSAQLVTKTGDSYSKTQQEKSTRDAWSSILTPWNCYRWCEIRGVFIWRVIRRAHSLRMHWTLHSTSLVHEPIFVGHYLILLVVNPLSKSLVCSADTCLFEWRRFGDLRLIL